MRNPPPHRPPRAKPTLRQRVRPFLPVAAAALACSAAITAWRVWPATQSFSDIVEPGAELLYHYRPTVMGAVATPPGPHNQEAYEEFAAEGFHFNAPTDYWERVSGPASPFCLLQPAFTLQRSESSPPSDFGVGACDFAISADVLPSSADLDDQWENLPSVLGLQARFSCGMPKHYEITGPAAMKCLRLVWDTLPGGGGEPPRQLEMWIYQRGEVAWSLTGLMPGATSSYILTRTMQRLAAGFTPLPQDPDLAKASLSSRDLIGALPIDAPPAPQPLYRWQTPPDDLATWPNGRLLAPGAEGLWTVGKARIALATLPQDGLENVSAPRVLSALRQIWPALRGIAFPVMEHTASPASETFQLNLPCTFAGEPAQCSLKYRASAAGIVLAAAFEPAPAGAPAPEPALLLENLDLTPSTSPGQANSLPSTLHLPLLQMLAVESHANGQPRVAADFHLALFKRSQQLEDLASACGSLASAGEPGTATALFDSGSQRFVHTPGWELYRILILARLGSATRAHRDTMELLAAQRFPSSLAAPYLDALISSQSWTQAKAFVSMLVRNDPDTPQWRLNYATILNETGERPKAISIIHATQQTWVSDPALGIECVQNLLRIPALQDASTLAGRLTATHPGHEQAWLMAGQCHTLLGRPEDARLAYQNALKAAPGSKSARLALAALTTTSAQSDTAFLAAAIDPVPLPAVLPDSLPVAPADMHSPALILSHITGQRYQRNRPSATTIHSRLLINNAEGMSQWNTLTFPVNPARERLTLHHLKVLNPQGKTLAMANLGDRYTTESANGTKIIHFPVPALTPGCIIDYAVTTENLLPADGWPCTHHDFTQPIPCLADIYYVTGDLSNLTWNHSTGKKPQPYAGTLIWQENRAARLPHAPANPTLSLGTVTDNWSTVGRHYLDQIRHRLGPDQSIVQTAARLTENCPTPAARIAALSQYVRSAISYTAIEFGYRAIIPHAAATTLANRFGDCKDHAVLLHSLLTAARIPAHLALIHSTTPPHPDFPALSQFDHMIVALPRPDNTFDFIDPTDKFLEATPGAAPVGLAGRAALILDPANPRLATTPPTLAITNGTLTGHVTLEENSTDAQITDHLTLTGPAAGTLRSQLASVSPAGQPAALRRLLSLDRLRDNLLSVSLTALRDPSLPLTIQLTSLSRGALHPSAHGLQLHLTHPLADYLLYPASLTDQAATGTVQLTTPIRLKFELTISPPSGTQLRAPAFAAPRSSPYGAWSCHINANSLTWTADLKPGRWSGSDAAACAQFPPEALLPLRQPWLLTPGPLASNQPPGP